MHKRNKKNRDRQTNSRETAELDSEDTSEEGGYFYNLRRLPVYRRIVRHQEPQPDTHSNLRAVAREFQPRRQTPEPEDVHQQEERVPVVVPEQTPADTPPVENVQEKPAMDEQEDDTGPEMPEEMAESVPGPQCGEPTRKSTRTVKPRERFTYEQFGQPSYQPWRPETNAVFTFVPYHITPHPTLPDIYYYPSSTIWTCETHCS